VYINGLGNIYNKTKNTNSNINNILFINGRANKKTEPNIGTVFTPLCQSHAK
jgi:hypothetical protein